VQAGDVVSLSDLSNRIHHRSLIPIFAVPIGTSVP
jgi:hypothetical protein